MGERIMRLKVFWPLIIIGLIPLLIPKTLLSEQARRIVRKDRRIALVIGNGIYKSSPLANPVNDANDIAVALQKCGFTVIKRININRPQIRAAVRTFGDQIKRGGVGLFFYAGHGIQVDGENYLVPK